MKLNKKLYIAAIALVSSVVSVAQNTQSGYFLDCYTYRYQMNPAMANDKNFVSMPGLGNVNIDIKGNLGLKDVLYNIDGRTSLFVNPGISAAEVMSNIKDVNKLNADVKLNVLSAGFKAFGGYNTVSINARVMAGTRLPKAFFSLAKEGITNTTYDITDLGARARAYVDLGLGHSRDINDEWRVGGTLKFIVGAGDVTAKFDRATLTLGEDSWQVQADGKLDASIKELKYKTKVNDNTGHRYVNGIDMDYSGVSGFGMGLDLGAVYSPAALPDWKFSVALLDLGFISWNCDNVASTNGLKSFSTADYTFNVSDDASNSFSNEWDKLKDDLSAIYELEDMGDTGSRTTMLGATLNIGAEYQFPLYNKLSFGLLNTTRIDGDYSWTDFRLSANVAPVKIFSAGISGAVGTFGASFGWIANLHVTGFNLFLGMDHTLGKLAKQGVPLNSNAQVNLGMNFLF